MPTPEKAQALGIKMDGLQSRMINWLSGIGFGLKAVDSAIQFDVVMTFQVTGPIVVATDSIPLMCDVTSYLNGYGATVTMVPEREWV